MSNKFRTLIIDDEIPVRSLTIKLIQRNCPQLEICGQAGSVNEGVHCIATQKPDLVFLDVQMADGTGFDLLEKTSQFEFKVIFLTAHQEHAIQAFRFSAIDYILKPMDSESLIEAVNRLGNYEIAATPRLAIQSLIDNSKSPTSATKLILKTLDNIYLVETKDIVYCQSEGNYTTFFLVDGRKILVSRPIKEYVSLLDDRIFFRSHQSYLVNMTFFREYRKSDESLVMKVDAEIPLATRKKEEFLSFLDRMK